MNVFLQGVPGVGKSTMIKRVLSELEIEPSGFITLSGSVDENGQSNVYMHRANSTNREENKGNLIGERLGEGEFEAHPETFEKLGIEILQESMLPLILMDEIGFMENHAFSYQRKLLEVLDGRIPVLGVIKAKETSFIREIAEHKNSVVIEVKEFNREETYEKVKDLIKKRLNING